MKTLALRIALLVMAAAATSVYSADPPAPPSPATANVEASNAAGPKIHFAEPDCNFGKVTSGQMIHHTFIVSNAGTATLLISDVRGTCGCTTPGEWTRQIEPGKTGVVPIQINSAGMQGAIHKAAIVTSNDKSQSTTTLNLSGEIWMPIEIHPMTAYLRATSATQTNVSTTVHITNKTDQPLSLGPPEVNNKLFTAEIKPVSPGKGFDLVVSMTGPVPSGPTSGAISMKTSVADMPVLTVNVMAFAPSPAIMVSPNKVMIGPAFHSPAAMRNVLIAATVPQSLELTNATVNAPGVEVAIKPLQPGRQYFVTLSFPAEFQAPAGGLELQIHSNFPQFPLIKVPIEQAPAAPIADPKKG